ncbi:MAG: sugar ABC transporter substrate-binding protein [Oscillospiraceae bacterium]
MKKLLAMLLVVVMAVSLFAGCGGGAESGSQTAGGSQQTESGELDLVGFCTVSMSESIYVLQEAALKEIFAGKATVQTATCDQDSALQIQQIKNFITMGADLLVINPTDIEALGDAIMEAHNAGIKVYINGATTDSLSEEYYDCCTVSDEYLCGAYVAMIAKNWIEAHADELDAACPDWELAFLESNLAEETIKRSKGEQSIVDPWLKDSDGNYVDISGNVVGEADRVANPAYCEIAAQHYAGVIVEQDQTNGGLNVANILTTNPNTRVFIAYNSLASTQGGQYIVDNYADEIDSFAFFSAGVMGNEADYMVGAVSATDGVTPSVMRGAVQFGVSAAGSDVADSVANTAYAILYGEEGVDYTKKNPDGIAAWWTVDEEWGSGTAYVAHFNILSGATVQAFDPIATLDDENTVHYWNSKEGFIVEEEPEEPAGTDTPDTPADPGVSTGAGAAVEPGEYSYMEATPFGEVLWVVTLNADGSAVVAQPENEGMGNPTWTAAWSDNGDGTFTTSDCQGDGPQIADFWEGNAIVWQLLNDGHTVPVKAGDYADHVAQYGIPAGGASGAAVEPGEYSFLETTPFGEVLWTVTLNADGSFVVAQPENEGMGNPTWTGTAWVDNGDGTFTTPDCQGDGPQIADFWKDNGITWTDNGDGTVTPVG